MDHNVDKGPMFKDIINLLNGETVDAIVIPIEADQRFNAYDTVAYSSAKALVPGITSKEIFILVTFYDRNEPIRPEWIDEIIESFKELH